MAIPDVAGRTGLPAAADLAGLSLTEVTAAEPLVFGQSAAHDLDLLYLLREATSNAVRLRWTLTGIPRFPLLTHVHLVPPSGGVGPAADYARRWAAGYRYGSYYYREGPDFVTVKDVRAGGEPVRMIIANGAAHFLAMASARSAGELSADAAAMLEVAEQAGLLIRTADRLLVLPYRIRHWPVPYVAI